MVETGLLERVLAGDETAMQGLVTAAWPRLGRGGQRVDHAELRQEALTELVAVAREQHAGPSGDFAELAVARLKRRMAAVVRAERNRAFRIRPLDPDRDDRAAAEGDTRLSAQVESPTLARALRRLPPRERAVIARVYWQELTAAEIAEREGVDPPAVRKLRRQAEAALRRALQPRR
jgi:RNA polymerase sigma factor (sigma-70 family)